MSPRSTSPMEIGGTQREDVERMRAAEQQSDRPFVSAGRLG